jgi:hypothetical protein
VSAEQFQAALMEIRATFEMLGRVGVYAELGVPEAKQRHADLVCELDYRLTRLFDAWPSARDDSGLIEPARAVRRLVNLLGEPS